MKYEITFFEDKGAGVKDCYSQTTRLFAHPNDCRNFLENTHWDTYHYYTITSIDLTKEPDEQVTLLEIGVLNK
jgi:hypothetical protein